MKVPIIVADELRFAYPGQGAFALDLPQWRVDAGSSVALFGPSGSGKSTLLDLLAGEKLPTAGQLMVLGQDLKQMTETQRRRFRLNNIGFIFQDSPLISHLTILDNVLFPHHLKRGAGPSKTNKIKADGLLERLGLKDFGPRFPGQLSQGERQRVAIARALILEPPLLLADEATSGLDADRASGVCELLQSLSRESGATLFFVTHDVSLLKTFPHQLNLGQLGSQGGF